MSTKALAERSDVIISSEKSIQNDAGTAVKRAGGVICGYILTN